MFKRNEEKNQTNACMLPNRRHGNLTFMVFTFSKGHLYTTLKIRLKIYKYRVHVGKFCGLYFRQDHCR